MVIWLTSWQVDKWTSCLWSRHGNMRTNFFFITSNLSNSSTYYVTLSLIQSTRSPVYSFTCQLVNLPCYSVFDTSNLFTCLLVHLSTNCLFLLNIKVNISIISIWVVWIIGVIRPILEKEYGERCKWLFVNELWEREREAFDRCKTVIA